MPRCGAIDLCPGEVDLATLPIFSLANLASGVTTVIPNADLRRPGTVAARPILRQIVRRQVTRCVASPAFFERLLQTPGAAESLPNVRQIFTGGAPVYPGLMARLQKAMPSAKIVALYGSTEAEPIAHIAHHEISEPDRQKMYAGGGLLAGAAVPDIDLRILANQWGRPLASMTELEFEQAVLPPTQPGEIVVHGAHVLRGYLNGQGDENTKFRVDDQVWHRTGDAGYLDETDRLWLLGRAEAKVEDAAGTIYPFAVECAASRIAGVHRSAMVQHAGKRLLVVQPEAGAGRSYRVDCQRIGLGGHHRVSFAKIHPARQAAQRQNRLPCLAKTTCGRFLIPQSDQPIQPVSCEFPFPRLFGGPQSPSASGWARVPWRR